MTEVVGARWRATLAVVAVLCGVAALCMSSAVDSSPVEPGVAAGTGALGTVVLSEAGVPLPAGARVLGVRQEAGRDVLRVVVVSVDEPGVAVMLDRAGFDGELVDGRRTQMPSVDRHEPGAVVTSGQDRHGVWMREVLVDRSDPLRPRVHWWLFTT